MLSLHNPTSCVSFLLFIKLKNRVATYIHIAIIIASISISIAFISGNIYIIYIIYTAY